MASSAFNSNRMWYYHNYKDMTSYVVFKLLYCLLTI